MSFCRSRSTSSSGWRFTNLVSDTSNAAIIVWKGKPAPGRLGYGVELVAPEMDFWGMDL